MVAYKRGRDSQAPKLQGKDVVWKVWSMFGAWSAHCNMRDAMYQGCDVGEMRCDYVCDVSDSHAKKARSNAFYCNLDSLE